MINETDDEKMAYKKLHFVYETQKEPNNTFAQSLIDVLGQTDIADADAIISIGGDGLLLQNLKNANGKPVYSLTPPESNSRGFWSNHNIHTAKDLMKKLETATKIPLTALQAKIKFANGRETIKHAFNDVAIERSSGQAVLMNLTANFTQESIGPVRIMGDGFVFSTAMGSTGTSHSYGGPATDILNDVIVLTGKGIYEPRGIAPVVSNAENSSFQISFGSVAGKRPVRIDYDGHSIAQDTDGSPIESLEISADPNKTAYMLVSDEPSVKAFRALTPQNNGKLP